MAITLVPCWDTPSVETGETPSETWRYQTHGDPNPATDNADNYAVALAFASTNVPAVQEPTGGDAVQLHRMTGHRIAPGVFEWECHYGTEGEFRITGETEFSFNTVGGSQHITFAVNHVQTYNSTGGTITTPQDGVLNVGEDGNANGMDIDIGGFNFQLILYVSVLQVTTAYIDLLISLTDTVNAMSFNAAANDVSMTFAPGECRFLGAQGALRAYGDWQITLNFSSYPNADGSSSPTLKIGGASGIVKRGWDHLYVDYQKAPDTTNKFLSSQVRNVYIDQVYFYENWSGLIPA